MKKIFVLAGAGASRICCGASANFSGGAAENSGGAAEIYESTI